MKRYLNRLRYLAMRHRPPPAPPRSLLARSKDKLLRRPPPVANAGGFDERMLVALSAIHQFRPEWVADAEKFAELAAGGFRGLLARESALTAPAEFPRFVEALQKSCDDFTAGDWEKAAAMRERFLEIERPGKPEAPKRVA